MIGRAYNSRSDPLMTNAVSFFTKNAPKFQEKYTNFGYQISPGTVSLCRKDRHTLLLMYFLTFLGCIRLIGRASSCIWDPLMVPTQCLFYPKHSQITRKLTNFGHQNSPGNVAMCHKDRHPLLLECFVTFLGCIKRIARDPGSISDPLMGNTVSFLSKTLSNFKQK